MLLNEIKLALKSAGKSDYRKMGISFGIILLLISGYCLYKAYNITLYLGIGGVALLFLGIVFPLLLKTLYNGWMSLALVIGFFMSRILLALIFYLIFAPVGLIMRLLKKDPLDRKDNPLADSYWIKRKKLTYNPGNTERQF